MPIGILGGTFDPIHFGHLRLALEVLEQLDLQEIRLLPSNVPPHRPQPVASAEQRLAMVRAAVAGEPRFLVDEREVRRPGPSYMAETLASLRAEAGDTPLVLVLGVDAFVNLGGWHHWQEIPRLAHIVVAHRPSWSIAGPPPKPEHRIAWELLERQGVSEPARLRERPAGAVLPWPVTQLDISSTAIRRMVAAGHSPKFLLPESVRQYIEKEALYR